MDLDFGHQHIFIAVYIYMIYCVCHRLPAPSDTFPGTSNFHRSVATGRLPAQCVPAPFPKTRNGRSGPILFGNPTPSSQSLDVMACFLKKLQDTDDFIQVSWLGPLTPDSYAQSFRASSPPSQQPSIPTILPNLFPPLHSLLIVLNGPHRPRRPHRPWPLW